MANSIKLIALGLVAFVGLYATYMGVDLAFRVHGLLIFGVAAGMFIWTLRQIDEPQPVIDTSGYMDGVIRAGVIATGFWGVVGFLAGVFIAFQLAFPALNFDWGQPFTNFGRLRPLHTSAVIFRLWWKRRCWRPASMWSSAPSGARLWGGNLGWFVFWGYQFFIVLAATAYLLGGTQGKEYAEPEWYIDLFLTLSGSALLAGLPGHADQAERTAYLCGKLVLPGLHHHRGDAAYRQQHLHPGLHLFEVGPGLLERCTGCDDPMVVRPQCGGLLPDRRLPGHDVLLCSEAGWSVRSTAIVCRSYTSGR